MQPHLMFGAATVADWYWLADDGRLYSSKRFVTVPKTDADYQAWLAAGFMTSRWPPDETGAQTDAALDDVLRLYRLSMAGAVRAASTYQLMSALTDAQRAAYPTAVKAWDQRFFAARDTPWPEGNDKIGRIAVALGTTPKAWFDLALNPPTA